MQNVMRTPNPSIARCDESEGPHERNRGTPRCGVRCSDWAFAWHFAFLKFDKNRRKNFRNVCSQTIFAIGPFPNRLCILCETLDRRALRTRLLRMLALSPLIMSGIFHVSHRMYNRVRKRSYTREEYRTGTQHKIKHRSRTVSIERFDQPNYINTEFSRGVRLHFSLNCVLI